MAVAVLALVCGVAQAADADPLDCTQPVHLGESAKALLARFGRDAKQEDRNDDEGTLEKSVTLFPSDPTHKLYVDFGYDTLNHAESVNVREHATAWLVRGVHLGSTLADVQAANGGSFGIQAWGGEGGGVADFGNGKLGKDMGRCRLFIRFEFPEGVRTPDDFEDSKRELLSSSDSKLRAFEPVVYDIVVSLVEAPATPR